MSACRHCALLLLLLLLALPPAARAAALPEAQVKAAFIFNFLLFTNWTHLAHPPAELQLCVAGSDAVARELRALDGRALGGTPVNVTNVRSAEVNDPCHALYLGASEQVRWPEWLSAPLAQQALTVTDSGEKLGGQASVLMVAVEQDRVVFGLDLKQAERHQLKFSARVLQLAQKTGRR